MEYYLQRYLHVLMLLARSPTNRTWAVAQKVTGPSVWTNRKKPTWTKKCFRWRKYLTRRSSCRCQGYKIYYRQPKASLSGGMTSLPCKKKTLEDVDSPYTAKSVWRIDTIWMKTDLCRNTGPPYPKVLLKQIGWLFQKSGKRKSCCTKYRGRIQCKIYDHGPKRLLASKNAYCHVKAAVEAFVFVGTSLSKRRDRRSGNGSRMGPPTQVNGRTFSSYYIIRKEAKLA